MQQQLAASNYEVIIALRLSTHVVQSPWWPLASTLQWMTDSKALIRSMHASRTNW